MTQTDTYLAFMMDHAAGSMSPAMMMAGDLHVALSDQGRDIGATWDVIAGALFELGPPEGHRQVLRRPSGRRGASPIAAARLLDRARGHLSWRRGLSGVDYAPTGVRGGRFMRLSPGLSAPRHSHSALEATVVLAGRLAVGGEEYVRGDLAFGEPGQAHKPAAIGEEDCICFVARNARPFWRLS